MRTFNNPQNPHLLILTMSRLTTIEPSPTSLKSRPLFRRPTESLQILDRRNIKLCGKNTGQTPFGTAKVRSKLFRAFYASAIFFHKISLLGQSRAQAPNGIADNGGIRPVWLLLPWHNNRYNSRAWTTLTAYGTTINNRRHHSHEKMTVNGASLDLIQKCGISSPFMVLAKSTVDTS